MKGIDAQPGARFGHLVVVAPAPSTNGLRVVLRCDCGGSTTRNLTHLRYAQRKGAVAVCSRVCLLHPERVRKAGRWRQALRRRFQRTGSLMAAHEEEFADPEPPPPSFDDLNAGYQLLRASWRNGGSVAD